MNSLAQYPRIVGFVSNCLVTFNALQQGLDLGHVVSVSRTRQTTNRISEGIDQGMKLGGRPPRGRSMAWPPFFACTGGVLMRPNHRTIRENLFFFQKSKLQHTNKGCSLTNYTTYESEVMFLSKRVFPTSLVVGAGLLVMLGVVSAAEEDRAGVWADGEVTVDGQEQSIGAALEEGDHVHVAEGGTAVVEFSDGCRSRASAYKF